MSQNYHIEHLRCGLTVILRHNDAVPGCASFSLLVHAGSIQEKESQRGAAHFVEHLAFRGVPEYPDNDLDDFIYANGASEINGITDYDCTFYYFNRYPVKERHLLQSGLRILDGWSRSLEFDERIFEEEKRIILDELRSDSEPFARIDLNWQRHLYQENIHSKRLPGSDIERVSRLTYHEVCDFYREWYRPELMCWVIVGDIDVAQIVEEVRKLRSDAPKFEEKISLADYRFSAPLEPGFVKMHNQELSFDYLYLGAMSPRTWGTKPMDIDSYAATLIAERVIEEEMELLPLKGDCFADSAAADIRIGESFFDNTFIHEFEFTVPPGRMQEAASLFLEERERLLACGVTAVELQDARKNLLKELRARSYRENEDFIKDIKGYFFHDFPLIEHGDTHLIEAISGCARRSINSKIKTLLASSPLIAMGVFSSIETGIDSEKFLQALSTRPFVNKRKGEDASPPKCRQPLILPYPIKRLKNTFLWREKRIPQIDLLRCEWGTKRKIYIKETHSGEDEVEFRLTIKGGYGRIDNNKVVEALVSPNVAFECGLASSSPVELRRFLKRMGMSITAPHCYVNSDETFISFKTSAKETESALKLLNSYLQPGSYDPRYGEAAKRLILREYMESQLVLRETVAKEVYNAVFPDLPEIRHLNEDEIKEFDPSQSFSIFQELVNPARPFSLFIVGNINKKILKKQIFQYLPPLSGKTKREVPSRTIPFNPQKGERIVYRGSEQVLLSLYWFTPLVERSSPQERVIAWILEEMLSLQLFQKIRGNQGGGYEAWATADLYNTPVPYFLGNIFVSCKPDEAKSILKEVVREVTLPVGSGTFDRSRFDQAKAIVLATLNEEKLCNSGWADYLCAMIIEEKKLYDPFAFRIGFLEEVTLEDIYSYARRWLTEERLFQLTLLPEKNKK